MMSFPSEWSSYAQTGAVPVKTVVEGQLAAGPGTGSQGRVCRTLTVGYAEHRRTGLHLLRLRTCVGERQ